MTLRLRRLSPPVMNVLGAITAVVMLLVLHALYVQWHSRDVWMWIDCADSPRVEAALRLGCDPNVIGAEGFPALCTASAVGSIDTTEMLLKAGARPDLATPGGDTPLMFACRFCNDPTRGPSDRYVEIVKTLLAHHAAPDLHNRAGTTALMCASAQNALDIVVALREAGANPQLRDRQGRTAEDYARQANHPETVAYLQSWEGSSLSK